MHILLLILRIGLGETGLRAMALMGSFLLWASFRVEYRLLQDEDKRLPYLINDQQAPLAAHRSIWGVTGQAQPSLILREVRALFLSVALNFSSKSSILVTYGVSLIDSLCSAVFPF